MKLATSYVQQLADTLSKSNNKIPAIKMLRGLVSVGSGFSLGLKEAKDFIDEVHAEVSVYTKPRSGDYLFAIQAKLAAAPPEWQPAPRITTFEGESGSSTHQSSNLPSHDLLRELIDLQKETNQLLKDLVEASS